MGQGLLGGSPAQRLVIGTEHEFARVFRGVCTLSAGRWPSRAVKRNQAIVRWSSKTVGNYPTVLGGTRTSSKSFFDGLVGPSYAFGGNLRRSWKTIVRVLRSYATVLEDHRTCVGKILDGLGRPSCSSEPFSRRSGRPSWARISGF